jgi:5-deoxy-glucuronate isomerase
MSPHPSPLLVAPNPHSDEYMRITPASAGWEHLHFAARTLKQHERFEWETGENELALVVLGGRCSVSSNRGSWTEIGRRANVFAGMPYTLYLPRKTRFTLQATTSDLDFAYGWCLASGDHPAQLVRPAQTEIEIRGGGNATRQINKMIPPGFDCSRLVVVEVYTPAGNWSSYPPHKHDQHRVDENGTLLEADLEEIYFYKIARPEGYAYQRVYTDDRSLDELMLVRDNHLVLSPRGYHPVVAAHGYDCYYLNMLAGSAQSLAASDDPEYAWVKSTWTSQDARVPLVTMNMESAEGDEHDPRL